MGAAAVSGTWTSSCLSTQRGDTQTPYYAKSYTFTLDASATVTVTAASTDHTPVLHVLSTTGDPQDHKEDAPDKFELAAGDYAVEVTTTTARATGIFTIAVSAVDAEQPEPATVSGLEASYDATVNMEVSFGFTFSPSAATPSVEPVSLSGLVLELTRSGDTATGSGTPTHAGAYTARIALTQDGSEDIFTTTINASCAAGDVEHSDRSCIAPVCTAPLGGGSVGSGVLEGSGSWESGCVLPAGRRSGNGTYYAKHYTFTLTDTARVTIDLTSDENTYLFLLSGHGPDGAKLRHDDGGDGYDSRLSDVSLTAGDYTITATTYGPYLDWRDFPYGRPEPLARFGSACIRHDFNWQNLRRIERDVDPGIDTWNATAKNEADRRLSADLHVVCWNAIGLETRPHPTDHFQREMAAFRSCQGKTLKVMTVVTTINNPGF